jgi:hypothetical protein
MDVSSFEPLAHVNRDLSERPRILRS